MSKNFFLFGSGDVVLTPRRDAAGVVVAVPTPIELPSCIDIGIEKKGEAKKHEGKWQYSLASAIAKRSVEMSLTCNMHSAKSLGVSTNEAVSSGYAFFHSPDTSTAIPTTPFTITAAPPSSGVFKADMGVWFEATGEQLTRVASSPITGQYSLVDTTGVYTFAAADVGLKVFTKYTYTVTGSGSSVSEYNRLQGEGPEYSLIATSGKYRSEGYMVEAPIVTVKDVSQPFKNGDFMAQKITIDVLANPMTGLVLVSNFNM